MFFVMPACWTVKKSFQNTVYNTDPSPSNQSRATSELSKSKIIREAIKKDYFSLLKDLNISNKLRNEKTELQFAAEPLEGATTEPSLNLYALLSDDQRFLVSSWTESRGWIANTNSKYDNLFSLITYLLRTEKVKLESNDLTDEIKSFIFRKA